MPGPFNGTVTLTLADTPYLLSDLILAVDPTAELAYSELTFSMHDGPTTPNTDPIYQGSSRMVSPGAGQMPVDYATRRDPGDSFTEGQGSEGNGEDTTNKTKYYFMSTAAGQKMHIRSLVR